MHLQTYVTKLPIWTFCITSFAAPLNEIIFRCESEFLYKSGVSNSDLSPRFSSFRMLFHVDWCVPVVTTVSEQCDVSPASVTVYQSTWYSIPVGLNLCQQCSDDFKQRTVLQCYIIAEIAFCLNLYVKKLLISLPK